MPPVAGWRDAALPATLRPAQVTAMLDSCDRTTVTGRRDFAILMVLARLGLRAAEVAGLDLDDLDWRAGELVVRGKARRHNRLPLPADVGEALVAYLREGRPKAAEPWVCCHDRPRKYRPATSVTPRRWATRPPSTTPGRWSHE